mgnify:FL=1
MQFTMKQRNYIVCPKYKNDVKFDCFGERVDYVKKLEEKLK